MNKREMKKMQALKKQIEGLQKAIKEGTLPTPPDARLNTTELAATQCLIYLLDNCIEILNTYEDEV